MEKISVFDARITYGRKYLGPAPTHALTEHMRLADADMAVIVSHELFWLPPQRSIDIVNARVAATPGAYGVYLLLSALPGEMPPVERLAETFRENRIAGFVLSNEPYGIPYDPVMLRDELSACEHLHIPVFYHRSGGNSFEYLCAILERHPHLTVVLSVDEEWPNARKIYPLLKAYPNLFLCLSEHVWMGAVEDLVRLFGAQRLLYSSSFPDRYAGGAVLIVQNADITQADKDAIFRGNLQRLVGGIGHA